jgi:hypothetical protein
MGRRTTVFLSSSESRVQWSPQQYPIAPPGGYSLPTTRHLLYFLYPARLLEGDGGVWQRNCDQMRDRLHLFNGSRTVVVAHQEGVVDVHHEKTRTERPAHTVDNPEWVKHYIRHWDAKVEIIDNNPQHGEVAAFLPLWGSVKQYTGPGDVSFYAHAKGTTRPVNVGVSVHPWASLLYGANLDHWPLVSDLLTRHPIAGSMKTLGPAARFPGFPWHYSGTFYWFRNDVTFARKWESAPAVWGGLEAWPGTVFTSQEAGCVFYEETIRRAPTGYNFPRLRSVLDIYREWSEQHKEHRREGATATPWLHYWGYE